MATWIVTGGAGFIGSNFVRLALARDRRARRRARQAHLRGQPREPARRRGAPALRVRARRHRRPRGGREALPRAPAAGGPELRGRDATSTARSTGRATSCSTNVVGTFELLEASRGLCAALPPTSARASASCTSRPTRCTARSAPTGAFRETTPYEPNSPYSASKAGADHLVRAWHHTYGLPALITNCSNNYGPYQFPEKLIPLMILNALEGKPLPIYGDGGNVRDWLHVEDHCRAILRVLEAGRPGADVQPRRPQRAHEPRDRRPHLRGARGAPPRGARTRRSRRGHRPLRRPQALRRRPARPRPPLRDRRHERATELGWRPAHDLAAACGRPCSGTSTTATGASTCSRAATGASGSGSPIVVKGARHLLHN